MLVDLSLFYNESMGDPVDSGDTNINFTKLPPGRQTFAGGTEFDVRGRIGLAIGASDLPFWRHVLDIPIAQKCRRLHILHGGWGEMKREKRDGTEVGVYRLRYADGLQAEVPIIYGAHLRQIYESDYQEALVLDNNTKLAWVGELPDKNRVRLFETAWENERPDVAIASVDLISRKTGTAPFLFAITVEP